MSDGGGGGGGGGGWRTMVEPFSGRNYYHNRTPCNTTTWDLPSGHVATEEDAEVDGCEGGDGAW